MRRVEIRLGITGRVSRHQRQIAGKGEIDQRFLRRLLNRIAAPGDLDIKPAFEQRLQLVAIGFGRIRPAIGIVPRERRKECMTCSMYW